MTEVNYELECPCGARKLNFTEVRISSMATGKDIKINVLTGQAWRGKMEVPFGPIAGYGDSHRVALMGMCDECEKQWTIVFCYHKENTFVEMFPKRW